MSAEMDPYIRNVHLFRTQCNSCVDTYIQTVADIREEVREALRVLRDAFCAPFIPNDITTAATILLSTISSLTPLGAGDPFAVHAQNVLFGPSGDIAEHISALLLFNINTYL
jgi:hypothetical protein